MGRHGVDWEDATTRRAPAREEEQRPQAGPGRLNRARSVPTQQVSRIKARILNVHEAPQRDMSGQLRFLGSITMGLSNGQ